MHLQNHADIGPYQLLVKNGQLPIYRAYETTHQERFIREFILTLKLGHLQASYFIEKFGQDPREVFAAQLSHLSAAGFGSVSGDDIRLNRAGLMQVDRLLHDFFLPEHRHARYT